MTSTIAEEALDAAVASLDKVRDTADWPWEDDVYDALSAAEEHDPYGDKAQLAKVEQKYARLLNGIEQIADAAGMDGLASRSGNPLHWANALTELLDEVDPDRHEHGTE